MIRSLSPYYISIPWVSPASLLTCTSYTVFIYIWNGDKTPAPATANFEITKNNALVSMGTDSTIDIARLIADFVEVNPIDNVVTGAVSAQATYWVKWEYTYNDEPVPQGATTKLFSRGFSYGMEGRNVETISNNILFQKDEFKANRKGVYCLPFIASETLDTAYSIISYPSSEIAVTTTLISPITNANELSKLLWIKLTDTTTDTYVIVKVNNVIVATILIEDELKYTPVNIIFQNKLGFQQSFTFFKERKDNLEVTSSEFESDRGQPATGKHQFVTFNVQARGGFKCWTGFINEENNETIQQLLLSERIWMYSDGIFTPVTIETKSQEWKTQLNDSLINYEIGFKYGYNTINNV